MLPKAFLASRFATLLAAALIGMAESTGIAPPPPIMFEEEIEWIAPDGNGDQELPFELLLDDGTDVSKPARIVSHLNRLLDGLRHRL